MTGTERDALAGLHVYLFDGCEHIIAESLEEALAIFADGCDGTVGTSCQLPDDAPTSVAETFEDGTWYMVTKTNAEWCAEHGKGWLCGDTGETPDV